MALAEFLPCGTTGLMATSAMREARKAAGLTIEQLADDVGISVSQLSRIERGERNARLKDAEQIARRLGVSVDLLTSDSAASPPVGLPEPHAAQPNPTTTNAVYRPAPEFFDTRNKMPVYASAQGSDDGSGELVIDMNPVDWVPRPYTLEHVKNPFAIVVTGDSMSPAYKPGQKAWVNPQLAPVGGDDCILYSTNHELGEERAMIKEFVRATSTHWILKQHNPPKELKLPRAQWQRIFTVVGKFNRS